MLPLLVVGLLAAPMDLSLELTPTWRAVGVEATYTGDLPPQVRAELDWRPVGEEAWRPGVDPVIEPRLRRIWASIGPLAPGSAIEVRLTLRESPTAKPVVLLGKTQTRSVPADPPKDAPGYWVRVDGDDANPGSREKPFASLGRAARAAKPGEVVRVGPGIYREANLLTGLRGEADRPIVFLAETGKEAVLDGGVDLPRGSRWQHHGGDHYSIVAPAELTVARYAVQEGQRLFLQPSAAALTGEKRAVPRAWALDAKGRRVHVRTGGKPASECAYSFGVHDQAFYLSRSRYVHLIGFTVRHYGGVGIRLSEGAEGCVVRDCVLRELPGAFFLKGETTQFNLVQGCTMTEPGLGDYPWEVIKTSEQTRQGVFCVAGRGNCFYDNRLTGWFDGLAIESWKNLDKLELNRDVDVIGNTITDIGDDAIEADGGGVNLRLWGNTIRNAHTALSLAPVERGPVWVARNTATFHNLFFKLNVGGAPSPGWAFCDHNTGVCLASGPDGGTGISLPLPKEECRNKVFRNNVLVVNEWCVRNGRPGLTLDGNVYWHVPGKPVRRFQWEGKTLPTLDALRKATGQERAGQYADPQLMEMTPGPNSPCRDRAVPIRGVNEQFKGKGPDVGAVEGENE
jgi:hypothetical protein